MSSVGMQLIKNDFEKTTKKMLDRANSQGAMARIYKVYQDLQTKRFQTEGSSERQPWAPLNPKYAQEKLKRFVSYPGGGRKKLIATSTLAGSVIGPGSPFVSEGISKHRAMFTSRSMTILVEQSGKNAAGKDFTYPVYVNAIRNFMEFSDGSLDLMKEELRKFVFGSV